MSSLLNGSDDASRKLEELSLKDIEVFCRQRKAKLVETSKRAHVGKHLAI